jgi:ssDNA-binding Zn-finger/Zn-ribbon topoisomerase 1
MEEGLGGLFGLVFIIAIIALIVYLVVLVASVVLMTFAAIAGMIAASGALWGSFVGIKNFYETFNEAHQRSKTKPTNPAIKQYLSRIYVEQPAYLVYPYDAGWFVLRSIMINVWEPTQVDAGKWLSYGTAAFSKSETEENVGKILQWAIGIGSYIGGLCHYGAAFLIVAIFTFLQSVFLFLASVASSILIGFLGIGTFIYSRYHRIYHRCPDCHHQMPIPVHICPKCSTPHTRLWPSAYGVFNHRCEGSLPSGDLCDEILPTFKFKSSSTLTQRCPSCDQVLEGLGGTNIHIPIVGGPGVGKSHYIVAATQELIEKHAPASAWEVTLPNSRHFSDYTANVALINAGKCLRKTSNADPSAKAYNLQIRQKANQPVPQLLYLYDAAGEYYTSGSSAQEQEYFKYVHGVLLIVDPFSIDNVRNAYSTQLSDDTVKGGIIKPSAENPDTVYENMLMLFETKLNLKRNQLVKAPIAVVVTKCDAFDLEQRLGEAAARKYMADHPNTKIRTLEDAADLVVRKFLEDYGAGNFVRNLDSHFTRVRFFSCSAIGLGNNTTSASKFEGLRVLDPLLWLHKKV